MKQQIDFRMQIKSILRRSRYVFFIIGFAALGYVALALLDAWIYQGYQNWRFQRELKGSVLSAGSIKYHGPLLSAPALSDVSRSSRGNVTMTAPGKSPLARLAISAIGLTAMILEGVDDATLRKAIGHIPGTSLPGQKGNIAIAGHRDTFFRGLRNIHKGDEITLTTLSGSYSYRVDSTKVVDPGNTEVLDESDDAVLTLITCYPFYFVGSAPQRFIVRAHRSPG